MSVLDVVVTEKQVLTPLVTRFRFEPAGEGALPHFSGGAHVVVELPEGDRIRRNAYSLISDPHDGSGYEIAVRREDRGRGGSLYLHDRVTPGDRLRIGMPANLFRLDLTARHHLMIAGGIGITPFLAQLRQARLLGLSHALHYAAPSRAEAAGLALLPEDAPVTLHFSDEGTRMDLPALLDAQPLGSRVYVCGPESLIHAVTQAAAALGWPATAVRSEAFAAPPPGAPFAVELARSGRRLEVGAHESLLEALEAAGAAPDWSCRGGACGRCETGVVSCDGTLLHHDHWLSPAERAAGRKIMPCMSRLAGGLLVLDL